MGFTYFLMFRRKGLVLQVAPQGWWVCSSLMPEVVSHLHRPLAVQLVGWPLLLESVTIVGFSLAPNGEPCLTHAGSCLTSLSAGWEPPLRVHCTTAGSMTSLTTMASLGKHCNHLQGWCTQPMCGKTNVRSFCLVHALVPDLLWWGCTPD